MIFSFVQIIIGVLLTISVILQSRGTGTGIAFGGAGESYRSKRGIEKVLFYATIALAALFAAISILALIY